MSATTVIHPAKAAMDLWRTTTPRPILDVVLTEQRRDTNGNTVFIARTGLAVYREQRDYTLTECENHVAVALEALKEYSAKTIYKLADIRITDGHGVIVFERLP
jgi:hypothetical protein